MQHTYALRNKYTTLALALIAAFCVVTEIVLWALAGAAIFEYSYAFSHFLLLAIGALVGICGGYKLGLHGTFGKALYLLGIANLAAALSTVAFDGAAAGANGALTPIGHLTFLASIPITAVGLGFVLKLYHTHPTKKLLRATFVFVAVAAIATILFLGFPSIHAQSVFMDTLASLYLIGDIVLLSLVSIVMYAAKNRMYRGLFAYLSGLMLHVAADFAIVHRVTRETYGGFGDPAEILYIAAAACSALGIVLLYDTFKARAQVAELTH